MAVAQVQEIHDRQNKPLNSLFPRLSNFSTFRVLSKHTRLISTALHKAISAINGIIDSNFFSLLTNAIKPRKKQHMKVNISIQFFSQIVTIFAVLVLDNKTVCFSNGLAKCKSTNKDSCVVLCTEWKLESEDEAGKLKDILKVEGKRFQNCSLILEGITQASTTWDEINPDDSPKIEDLEIIHSRLDLNQLNLKIFKNLRRLTMENTTTDNLRLEVFRQLPKLQRLQIKQHNCIKWAENGIFRNMSLESLQINGINLDQARTAQFFKNLTGGFEAPGIHELDWSHNNFGNFTKDLLSPFRDLTVLILTNSNISTFGDYTFTTGNIKSVFINQNKIQRLPKSVFSGLMENASFVSVEENDLICDCEMKWLQNLIKRRKHTQKFQISCAHPVAQFLDIEMCPAVKDKSPTVYCTSKDNLEIADDYRFLPILEDATDIFTITKNEPGVIEITISNTIASDGVFIWYGNYANTTSPKFKCQKILQQKFSIHVTPEANYLICLATIYTKHFYCLPFRTNPHHENQPWLMNKSKALSIVCISVVFLLAAAVGALILYLSVRKNPSLIRGSKRVIEVKRHDKAQVLIMPRGYENSANQGDPSSLALLNPLQPTLSCDTISTVSYVSAHQPTQLEILTYRLNRLRELFQRNNNLPPPIPRMPMQIAIPVNQRLPPDVDLLFEYEWYTITTTTTTTTTTEL